MANSIIDDMLKNQVPNKKNKSGSKAIIVILILLIIIGLIIIGVLLYLKSQNKMTTKDSFLYYLKNVNTESILSFEKLNSLNTRLQNENVEATTDITGNISNEFLKEKIDLSEMKINLVSKNNPEAEKNSSDVLVTYKDNDIVSFNILSDSDRIGFISEDIVIRYVVSRYSNLGKIFSKISGNEFIKNIDFSKIKNSNLVLPKISNEMFTKYVDAINQKIPENAFASKLVTLERNSNKVDVTEYSMRLTETQVIELIDFMLQILKSDDYLLDTLLSSIGDEIDRIEVREKIKAEIEKYASSLYEKIPDDSKTYFLKVYGKDDLTYRITIDLWNGEASMNIDYNYSDKSNSMNITFLENETNDGVSIDLVKTVSDVTENLDFTINIVENSDIVGKFNIDLNLISSRKFIYLEK